MPISDRSYQAGLQSTLGGLRAMEGNFDEARSLWVEARTMYEELGLRARRAGRSLIPAEIELLAGNPGEAVAILRWACEKLEELGVESIRATTRHSSPTRSAKQATSRRRDVSRTWLRRAERPTTSSPRSCGASPDRRRTATPGSPTKHLLAQTTDYPDLKARAFLALGELAEARRIYEAKGNVAAAERLLARQTASS